MSRILRVTGYELRVQPFALCSSLFPSAFCLLPSAFSSPYSLLLTSSLTPHHSPLLLLTHLLTLLNYSSYFALSEYVLSLVSIFILSPVFTNNGTIILAPVSTSAGLSELVEEVSPFIPGSV